MLAFIAYAGSLIGLVTGAVMLFLFVVGPGQADNKTAFTAAQARPVPASITKPSVSSASKVAESRAEAPKPKKQVVRQKPRSRVADRRQDYHSPYGSRTPYGFW